MVVALWRAHREMWLAEAEKRKAAGQPAPWLGIARGIVEGYEEFPGAKVEKADVDRV